MLQEASEKDLLRSDTYKRLNLGLMWWGAATALALWLAPALPLRYALGCGWAGPPGPGAGVQAPAALHGVRRKTAGIQDFQLGTSTRRTWSCLCLVRRAWTALLAATSAHAALTYHETSEQGEGLNPIFLARQSLSSLGNLARCMAGHRRWSVHWRVYVQAGPHFHSLLCL